MAMVLKEEKYTISKSGNSTIRDFLATTVAVIWKLFLWLVVGNHFTSSFKNALLLIYK